ncbi:MAG TPA: carbohydrate ABC transporter permease [Candidatus Faecaligallichristensenella faecipullorum]|nr:carbohydrate ABC transporter permease [Candidatus Faecaligallichristensenella faecipullorum]
MQATRKKRKLLHNPVLHIILIILVFFTFYPLFFTVMTSFKDNEQFYANFWALPNPVIWKNYADAFSSIMPYLGNSLIISFFSILGILLTTSLSAYTFARLRFPGKEIVFLFVLALLMIPSLLQLIPQFILLRDLRLLNSYFGVILGYLAGKQAFSIFIIRSFFESQPEELFEAARIDGCNEVQAYARIALPLIKPILGTVAIMSLLDIWNDYLWPLIVTSDPSKFTIALGLMRYKSSFTGTVLYGPLFAGYVVTALPLIVLFLCLMNSFIEGLTAGAVKA